MILIYNVQYKVIQKLLLIWYIKGAPTRNSFILVGQLEQAINHTNHAIPLWEQAIREKVISAQNPLNRIDEKSEEWSIEDLRNAIY